MLKNTRRCDRETEEYIDNMQNDTNVFDKILHIVLKLYISLSHKFDPTKLKHTLVTDLAPKYNYYYYAIKFKSN